MENICKCGGLKTKTAKMCKGCYTELQKIEAKVKVQSISELMSSGMKKQHLEARNYRGTRVTDVFSEMGNHFYEECPECGLPLEKNGSCLECCE